jgi:hypothetical protein
MKHGGRAAGGVLTADDLRGQSQDWADRRKEPRIPCDREILILPTGFSECHGFRRLGLYDVSARGVGIVSPEAIGVGEQFLAKLRLDRVLLAVYTVQHCTPAADGKHFKIGAEFIALIGRPGNEPKAVLDSLLGRGDPGTSRPTGV